MGRRFFEEFGKRGTERVFTEARCVKKGHAVCKQRCADRSKRDAIVSGTAGIKGGVVNYTTKEIRLMSSHIGTRDKNMKRILHEILGLLAEGSFLCIHIRGY